MNYSDKINFQHPKKYDNKFSIIIIAFLLLTFTIFSTIVYKKIITPTEITFNDVNSLINNSHIIENLIKEKLSDTYHEPISYTNSMDLINFSYTNSNTLEATISLNLQFPTGFSSCFATIEIEYKYNKGWYVNDIIHIIPSEFSPFVSAGNALLDIILDAVYLGDGFIFNNVDYHYPPSYVDSLYILYEEGDLRSTKVRLGSYNPDAAHSYGILSYDFEESTWKLIDFYAEWERP